MINSILVKKGISKFAPTKLFSIFLPTGIASANIDCRYDIIGNKEKPNLMGNGYSPLNPAFGAQLFDDTIQINNLNLAAANIRVSGACKKTKPAMRKFVSKIRGIS